MKLIVDVRWDDHASVWYAVSRDKTGLATEAASLDELRDRILLVVPDLFETIVISDIELVVHGLSKTPIAAE